VQAAMNCFSNLTQNLIQVVDGPAFLNHNQKTASFLKKTARMGWSGLKLFVADVAVILDMFSTTDRRQRDYGIVSTQPLYVLKKILQIVSYNWSFAS
jgi:hypothetical protein